MGANHDSRKSFPVGGARALARRREDNEIDQADGYDFGHGKGSICFRWKNAPMEHVQR